MRLETLDMRFLLTVGFSLRTEATQTHPVSGGMPTIPSPQAEKEFVHPAITNLVPLAKANGWW